ncbi:MAG: beta-propeller fold lactonase family protein [Gammaproteobacteria bacterium]|nr:beta-propeller fold lactonase family protein [Gammaproteobacteria bacterium]
MHVSLKMVIASSLVALATGSGAWYYLRAPDCMAWDPASLPGIESGKHYLYVAMGGCNSVLAIDTGTQTVAAYASLAGRFPHGLMVDPKRKSLYVANEKSDDLSVLGLPEFAPRARAETGDFPVDVTLMSDRILVTNFSGDSVSVIDPATLEAVWEVDSEAATHFAVSPDRKYAYLSNWSEDTVSVLDSGVDAVVAVIRTGKRPNHLTFSRDGRFVYVTNYKGDSVTVIDHRAGRSIAEIPVGKRPMTPITTADRLYVANIESGTISVIDIENHQVLSEIPTGGNPQHMAIAGNWLYVTNPDLELIQVIDLSQNRVVKEILTGPSPQQISPRYLSEVPPY